MQGFRYFLTIVDDYSRYTWVILLHNKSEVRPHIINFTVFVQNHFKTNIKTIRTNNGVEFAMSNFYASKGITHQTSCVYVPQCHFVERKHQHILNVTRALLFQANLPPIFWEFVVNHVVFLINYIPTPLLNNITPHEQLSGKPYDISFLKVFCCLCYASTITAHRKKLNDRSTKGIFLGFPQNTKGYIVLNLKFHRIEISRHIIFHETHFPYKLDIGLPRDPNTLSLPISNAYNYALDFFF